MTDGPVVAEFLARANLTLQGQQIDVGAVVTLVDDDEVKACVSQFLLVPRGADGQFADLGPVGRPPLNVQGCCGRR